MKAGDECVDMYHSVYYMYVKDFINVCVRVCVLLVCIFQSKRNVYSL